MKMQKLRSAAEATAPGEAGTNAVLGAISGKPPAPDFSASLASNCQLRRLSAGKDWEPCSEEKCHACRAWERRRIAARSAWRPRKAATSADRVSWLRPSASARRLRWAPHHPCVHRSNLRVR